MSRVRQTAIALGLGVAALLGASACGVGQVTQTDSMLPAVNGNMGQLGPIAIRDAVLAYPQGGRFEAGEDAPLVLAIVNTGAAGDELVDVRSPVAEDRRLVGDRNLPGNSFLAVGEPDTGAEEQVPAASPTTTATTPPSSPGGSPTSAPPSPTGTTGPTTGPTEASPTATTAPTTTPTEPVEIGKLTVVLTRLTEPVDSGRTVPVTFVFRTAGSITLDLPMATPATARPAPTEHG